MISRRSFLAALPVALAVVATPTGLRALRRPARSAGCTHAHPHHVGKGLLAHPEPRPGITADGVIPTSELLAQGFSADVAELWDGIAAIPGIADGIACYCGCMGPPMNKRSLLVCYTREGMARGCEICQGTARLVIRRHGEGQSLERIRAAVDARYAM